MELGHGLTYRIMGRRFHGGDRDLESETYEGCVYKGRTEWSTQGEPMETFWSPEIGHFLFYRPGSFEAEERL